MTTDTLLWHNRTHGSLEQAIDAACAAFARRTGLPPTNVILPLGNAPEMIGKLRVETSGLVRPWHLQVYSVYQTGDVICSICSVVIRNEPKLTLGVSHGYCKSCGDATFAEFEAALVVRQLELI